MDLKQAIEYLEARAGAFGRATKQMDDALNTVFAQVSSQVPVGVEVVVANKHYRVVQMSNWVGTSQHFAIGVRVRFDDPDFTDWRALHYSALTSGSGNVYSWIDTLAPREYRLDAANNIQAIVQAFADKMDTLANKAEQAAAAANVTI